MLAKTELLLIQEHLKQFTKVNAKTQFCRLLVDICTNRKIENPTNLDIRELIDEILEDGRLKVKVKRFDENGEEFEETKCLKSVCGKVSAQDVRDVLQELNRPKDIPSFQVDLPSDGLLSDYVEALKWNAPFVETTFISDFLLWSCRAIKDIRHSALTGHPFVEGDAGLDFALNLTFYTKSQGSGKTTFCNNFVKSAMSWGIPGAVSVGLPKDDKEVRWDQATSLVLSYREKENDNYNAGLLKTMQRRGCYTIRKLYHEPIQVQAVALTLMTTNGGPALKDDRTDTPIPCSALRWDTRVAVAEDLGIEWQSPSMNCLWKVSDKALDEFAKAIRKDYRDRQLVQGESEEDLKWMRAFDSSSDCAVDFYNLTSSLVSAPRFNGITVSDLADELIKDGKLDKYGRKGPFCHTIHKFMKHLTDAGRPVNRRAGRNERLDVYDFNPVFEPLKRWATQVSTTSATREEEVKASFAEWDHFIDIAKRIDAANK